MVLKKGFEKLDIVDTDVRVPNSNKLKESVQAVVKAENVKIKEKFNRRHQEDDTKYQKLAKELSSIKIFTKILLSHLIKKSLNPSHYNKSLSLRMPLCSLTRMVMVCVEDSNVKLLEYSTQLMIIDILHGSTRYIMTTYRIM